MLNAIKIFLFTFIYTCCNYSLEILPLESMILEKFFRTMVENSEGGYVFLEKKPICIHGFHKEDWFINENERHLDSVCLREGALTFKALTQNLKKNNIVIHVYNQEDTLVRSCIHILFINQKLCLEVINSNLSLFQYVLGPDVTPRGLLDKLMDPNSSFHATLKDDKVLIGILLGFGTQNSLYVSRTENIEDELFNVEQPPPIKARFLKNWAIFVQNICI